MIITLDEMKNYLRVDHEDDDILLASGDVIEAVLVHTGQVSGVAPAVGVRSEERRVGKECRSRWSPYH